MSIGASVPLNSRFTPWIGGAALTGSAIFFSTTALSGYLQTALLLFWPLLDRRWNVPAIHFRATNLAAWAVLILAMGGLVTWQPSQLGFAITALLFTALPEEWFFRAYFMTRLGSGWRANLVTSLVFSLLHGLVWGLTTAALVFVPSLVYGWLYQRTRDIVLLILLHALSNLIFVLFLADYLAAWQKTSAV